MWILLPAFSEELLLENLRARLTVSRRFTMIGHPLARDGRGWDGALLRFPFSVALGICSRRKCRLKFVDGIV